jgi:hypothetical protein
LNLDDIDPVFGTTQAEQLMRNYAYVAVQLDSLCYELEFYTFDSSSSSNDTEDISNTTYRKAVESTELLFNDKAEPIGINLELFEKPNLESLEKANRENDPEIDDILRKFENMSRSGQKPFASTFIVPLMKKVRYDPRLV